MALTVQCSIISIDSNITDYIIRKVINVYQKMCQTKNRALRKSSISGIFLQRLSIQNYSKPSNTEKRQNTANQQTQNFISFLSLCRGPACYTLSKALDISSPAAGAAPYLLKTLAIVSDTTVRRSAVDQEDLKAYRKSEKKPALLQVINNLIIYKFFKDISNYIKMNSKAESFSCAPFPKHS